MNEWALYVYKYIVEIELALLMEYKFNPFDLTNHITMIDLQFYIQQLEKKIKERDEARQRQPNNNFSKSLIAIRDILNYMTYKD